MRIYIYEKGYATIMDNAKIKKIVGKLLKKGESLGNILKILDTEYKQEMTFLELRILASELEDIDWTKDEEPEPVPEEEAKEEPEEDTSGQTVVEVNKLTRPGVAMHGSVKFASGASADWILDQMGRLGLEKSDGKPTPEDLEEFQKELQKMLGQGQ